MIDHQSLLERYRAGTCTEAEKRLVENWLLHYRASDPTDLTEDDFLRIRLSNWESVREETITTAPQKRRYITWLPYAAAVAILALGLFLVDIREKRMDPTETMSESSPISQDVLPGGNRATLKLADGRTIRLDQGQQGIVIGAQAIMYDDGTALDIMPQKDKGQIVQLELTTPKGGTYQVTLPDGSKVWLNAASTLKYPSRFAGNERIVELEGEAYFEVVQIRKGSSTNHHQPFFVKSVSQTIEVLGTQFNVSAYADEADTKTTLVEGSVQIKATQGSTRVLPTLLKPRQQSTMQNGKIHVKTVDTELYTSWRQGYFAFHQAPLQDVLTQLSRWYDIDIIYEGTPPVVLFDGEIGRDLTLQQVLKGLSTTRIRYRIDGRTLTIK